MVAGWRQAARSCTALTARFLLSRPRARHLPTLPASDHGRPPPHSLRSFSSDRSHTLSHASYLRDSAMIDDTVLIPSHQVRDFCLHLPSFLGAFEHDLMLEMS